MAHNARPRLIYPCIWQDPDLVDLSRDCRLFFIGLISHADDHGKLEADARRLKIMIFPCDTDIGPAEIEQMLGLLSDSKRNGGGHIELYDVDNVRYLRHPSWHKYDRFRRPLDSAYPDPDDSCTPHDGRSAPSDGQRPSSGEKCPPKGSKEKGSKEKGGKGTVCDGYAPSREAESCVAAWEKRRALPKPENRADYCKTFDDMHGIDKLSWERIQAICRHACEVWLPAGYIQSLSKLRRRSREYPDLWTWQVIEGQLHNGHASDDSGSSSAESLEAYRRRIRARDASD